MDKGPLRVFTLLFKKPDKDHQLGEYIFFPQTVISPLLVQECIQSSSKLLATLYCTHSLVTDHNIPWLRPDV